MENSENPNFKDVSLSVQNMSEDVLQSLTQTKELLEAITNNTGAGIAIIGLDYRIIWLNKAFRDIFGDVKSEKCYKAFRNRGLPCVNCSIKKVFNGKPIDIIVDHRITPEGNEEWFEKTTIPLKNADGKIVAALELGLNITERKIIENRLLEAEKRYHALFEQSSLGIVVSDPESLIPVEFNQVAYQQLGYSKEEFKSISVKDFEALETPEKITDRVAKILKSGKDEFITQHKTKTGKIRDVMVTIQAIELSKKKFLLSTYHDITEYRAAERALIESETRFKDIVSNLDEWIWEVDNQGSFTYSNGTITEILGYTPQQVLGKHFYDFSFVEEEEKTKQKALKVFRENKRFSRFISKLYHKDGYPKVVEVRGVPFFNVDGSLRGYRGAVRDVTEDKVMEDYFSALNHYGGLLSSAKSFDTIYGLTLEAMSQLLGLKNATIFIVNKNELLCVKQKGYRHPFCATLPLDKSKGGAVVTAAINKSSVLLSDVSSEADSFKVEENIHSQLAVPLLIDAEVVGVLNAEDKKINAFDQVHEMLLEVLAKHVAAAISNVKKIEEIQRYSQHLELMVKKRTQQLEEAQKQLLKSERLAAIGELSGMVGHDLRNPLTGIKNAAFYLRKKQSPDASKPEKQMIELIDKAVDHANKIINDLLEYSREIRLDYTECSPKCILTESLTMLQVPGNINLINKMHETPKVTVDQDKIKRVFINLIKNAFDAMPTGGTLEVKSQVRGDEVDLIFADTGVGMSDEVLSKIFTPLFTTKAKGMGFGLAICKRIVDAHGGRIAIKSSVGQGTTFTVTLPVKPKASNGGGKN